MPRSESLGIDTVKLGWPSRKLRKMDADFDYIRFTGVFVGEDKVWSGVLMEPFGYILAYIFDAFMMGRIDGGSAACFVRNMFASNEG